MSATAVRTQELQEQIRAHSGAPLLPVGARTKPALTAIPGAVPLDLSGLSGILEYDPAELTLTALAGTPVRELEAQLAPNGQHLPFDPPFAHAGATLGGAVATGAAGPSAFRHGGIRDFVIGVRLLDGTGTLVAGGGKVVKNAAGFDLPKLMVGSLGRLGVIVELSLKIFPSPQATTTLEFERGSLEAALEACAVLGRGPLALEALDILPGGGLLVRLGGEAATLHERSRRLCAQLDATAERHDGPEEAELWHAAAELKWVPDDHALVRVAITAHHARALEATAGTVRYSLGANVAWIAWPPGVELSSLHQTLLDNGLTGMVLKGEGGPLIGRPTGGAFGERVVTALDPDRRFPRF